MNKKIKKDLIKEVAKIEHKSEREVTEVVNAFIEELCNNLIDGNDVSLNNLGAFVIEETVGRTVVNNLPGQKAEYYLKPTRIVKFRVSEKLQKAVKQKNKFHYDDE